MFTPQKVTQYVLGAVTPEVVLVTVLGGDDPGVLPTRDLLVADGGGFVLAHSP